MAVIDGWYEIHIIRFGTNRNLGVTSQPIPPNVGDRVNLHFRPGNIAEVVSRTFDYTKGLYVTIEVAFV